MSDERMTAEEAFFRCSNCLEWAGSTPGCEGCLEFMCEHPEFERIGSERDEAEERVDGLVARLAAVEGDVLLLASAAEDVANCYVMAPSEATGSTATHIEQMGYVLEGMIDRLRALATQQDGDGR